MKRIRSFFINNTLYNTEILFILYFSLLIVFFVFMNILTFLLYFVILGMLMIFIALFWAISVIITFREDVDRSFLGYGIEYTNIPNSYKNIILKGIGFNIYNVNIPSVYLENITLITSSNKPKAMRLINLDKDIYFGVEL